MVNSARKKSSSSFCLWSSTKWCHKQSPPSSEEELTKSAEEEKHGHGNILEDATRTEKKPGGWKAMPYILGNETFERLASSGLSANFMVYLTKVFHMEQVVAANVINIYSGISNFAPLLGAYLADAHVGKFATIAFASFASLLGMVIMTLTAWLPQLHPPKCRPPSHCVSPNKEQLGALFTGLVFLSIGSGGIKPCSIPFAVDQFDPTTEEGIQGISSFYNWYYISFTVVLLIAITVVVYIQDSVSWVLGFGIPTALMVCAIVLFFVGTRIYVILKPEGSVFSGIGQVFVAAYKKRRLKVPDVGEENGAFYDPPLRKTQSMLPFTNKYRFLNKAAMIVDNDLKPDNTPADKWRLCSTQQVEEVKCLIKVIPIWVSCVISFTSLSQQGTFTISQALIMDRHLGKFQIPAGSVSVISMITIGIWLPFYDRIVIPSLRKITGHEAGITVLQRIGIGIVFGGLSMIAAGLVERERRAYAVANPHAVPMSVMWLAPQFILMGLCEAFFIIGQIEFFNNEFPDKMRSFGNSMCICASACASYLSSALITTVHKVTATKHHPNWLANDLNAGRLDYFFFVVSGFIVLSFLFFLICANRYHYKAVYVAAIEGDDKPHRDVELSSVKP